MQNFTHKSIDCFRSRNYIFEHLIYRNRETKRHKSHDKPNFQNDFIHIISDTDISRY